MKNSKKRRIEVNEKIKNEVGITLVALVVTIIVLIILAGVSISIVAGENGLLNRTKQAKEEYLLAANEEQQKLANLQVAMENETKTEFNPVQWDKKAAPEEAFIWQSDDENNEGYGVIVGYTANIDNYPSLRIPSRCTKIEIDISSLEGTDDQRR